MRRSSAVVLLCLKTLVRIVLGGASRRCAVILSTILIRELQRGTPSQRGNAGMHQGVSRLLRRLRGMQGALHLARWQACRPRSSGSDGGLRHALRGVGELHVARLGAALFGVRTLRRRMRPVCEIMRAAGCRRRDDAPLCRAVPDVCAVVSGDGEHGVGRRSVSVGSARAVRVRPTFAAGRS